VLSYKDWSFTFENDILADGGDRYRTYATVLSFKEYSLGLNMFTGDPGLNDEHRIKDLTKGPNGTYIKSGNNDPDKYRMGALYFGYKNYRIGANSEHIRNFVQNKMIHNPINSPHFAMIDRNWHFYSGVYSQNPFTAW
jgi:hypothetical protein